MARCRLIIHGSQEELEMFEPIYNTRLRLQHGAPPCRFHIPDPLTSVESEREIEDMDLEGGVTNIHTADHNNNEAAEERACCSTSDSEENDSLPDHIPHSTTPTDDQVGFADNGNTGAAGLSTRLQGNGSETAPASASCPDSDTDTDHSDSDS